MVLCRQSTSEHRRGLRKGQRAEDTFCRDLCTKRQVCYCVLDALPRDCVNRRVGATNSNVQLAAVVNMISF
jgi:hypothetical protein